MPAIPPLPRSAPRRLAPAPPVLAPAPGQMRKVTTFSDMPPELRVEIFKYVIAEVHIWITPVPGEPSNQPSGQLVPRKRKKTPPTDPPTTDPAQQSSQPPPQQQQQQQQQQTTQQLPNISNILTLLSPSAPGATQQYHPHFYASHSTTHPPDSSAPRTTTIHHPRPRTTPKPHPLTLTCHTLRSEALPLLHETRPIHATILNFDFSPLLAFLGRIPPDHQHRLCKNPSLEIELVTTVRDSLGGLESLRRWLHLRADVCRPQAGWRYVGHRPGKRIVNDLRRRVRRMKEEGKRREFMKILEGLGIDIAETATVE